MESGGGARKVVVVVGGRREKESAGSSVCHRTAVGPVREGERWQVEEGGGGGVKDQLSRTAVEPVREGGGGDGRKERWCS
jgi:hypothetical protein